ncbi:MAG TPA: ParB/RepB/Spo0J family partition protein [Actinomycetota bacterium]
MSQPRGGLGRGLSALLPADRPASEGPALRLVDVEAIRPNPRQPRAGIDQDGLAELAASIRSVGVLQPILVRPVDDGYELIAGERRWRASMLAGLERLPAIVRSSGDEDMLRDALIENLQREDLNPLEEAAAFRQLVDDLGATHEEIAQRVGRSRAAVTNALRLLALAPEVQQRIAGGSLSAAHGRAIAALADPGAQARAAMRAVAEGLSARQTEDMVRQMAGMGDAVLAARAAATRAARPDRPAGYLEAEVILSDILSSRVKIEGGPRRGRVVIEFAGGEDLSRIVELIQGKE